MIDHQTDAVEPGGSSPEVGAKAGADQMFNLVYDSLRDLARCWFRSEKQDDTLQATALVHEAYLKLAGTNPTAFRDQAHFFALAARAMREVLIDHARRRAADKRGGSWGRLTLHDGDGSTAAIAVDILTLDDAMTKLALFHERSSRVVELRFFGGLTVDETAGVLGVSPRTIHLDWRFARAHLLRTIARGAK